MAREQDKTYDTDRLETAAPRTATISEDSPTTASDAGLDDELLEETGNDFEVLEEDLNEADGEFDEDVTSGIEIPISDIDMAPADLASPEMSDSNVPGEIDIEELDEHALDDTDLPADARLDPLED